MHLQERSKSTLNILHMHIDDSREEVGVDWFLLPEQVSSSSMASSSISDSELIKLVSAKFQAKGGRGKPLSYLIVVQQSKIRGVVIRFGGKLQMGTISQKPIPVIFSLCSPSLSQTLLVYNLVSSGCWILGPLQTRFW
jgi:hypothetical protein